MEIVPWFEWEDPAKMEEPGNRLYIGNESCQLRLPDRERALAVARQLREAGKELTVVTSFLTDETLDRTVALIGELAPMFGNLEVVCNDWGLLDTLADGCGCVPIAGRLLTKQDTDPRIATLADAEYQSALERYVTHIDGASVLLRYAPPPASVSAQIRSSSLDCPEVSAFLGRLGVSRFEVSNVLQGLEIQPPPGWHVTLHVPDVLVSVARYCNVPDDGRGTALRCGTGECVESVTAWRHDSFPVPLYHVNNAIYYLNGRVSDDCRTMGVDRIVLRKSAARWHAAGGSDRNAESETVVR